MQGNIMGKRRAVLFVYFILFFYTKYFFSLYNYFFNPVLWLFLLFSDIVIIYVKQNRSVNDYIGLNAEDVYISEFLYTLPWDMFPANSPKGRISSPHCHGFCSNVAIQQEFDIFFINLELKKTNFLWEGGGISVQCSPSASLLLPASPPPPYLKPD